MKGSKHCAWSPSTMSKQPLSLQPDYSALESARRKFADVDVSKFPKLMSSYKDIFSELGKAFNEWIRSELGSSAGIKQLLGQKTLLFQLNLTPFPHAVSKFYQIGANMVRILPFVKQVPVRDRKLFEQATKEFSRVNRFDYVVWFAKQYDLLNALVQVSEWPDLDAPSMSDDTSDSANTKSNVTLIGRIKVINQSPLDPAQTIDLIKRATQLIGNSGVPRLSDVLYGDVLMVGDVGRKKNVLAMYYSKDDHIEVRVLKRFGSHELTSVIHEFGHRYWRKFASKDMQAHWKHHHNMMLYTFPNVDMPKVGDVLEARKGNLPIVSETSTAYITSDGGSYDKQNVRKVLVENARRSSFPTLYAATDAEEHFCESLSLFCVGDLKAAHLEVFKKIVLGVDTPDTRTLVSSWGPCL